MGGFLGMANAYSVDKHPKKNAIVRDLVNQVPYSQIAGKYGMTVNAVQRYATGKLRMSAAKALAKGNYSGEALLARIEDTIVYVSKMYEACNDWLQDPDDHSRYNLDPRAYEHDVIYNEVNYDDDDKEYRIRKKANLQELLERAMRDNEEIIKVESKISDPRKLILDTAQTLNKQLETLAKIAGVVQEVTNVDVNINMNTHLASNVIQIIQREVDDPAVVQRIVEGLTHDA
jgi:hypothetical protein